MGSTVKEWGLMQRADSLGEHPGTGKDRGQEEKGVTEDEMVR